MTSPAQRREFAWPWRIAARIFIGLNVAGGIFAIANGEPMHAMVHAALLVVALGGYLMWRIDRRIDRSQPQIIGPNPATELLDRLQQTVDRIALDVERVGEAQRFQAKLLEQQSEDPPTHSHK